MFRRFMTFYHLALVVFGFILLIILSKWYIVHSLNGHTLKSLYSKVKYVSDHAMEEAILCELTNRSTLMWKTHCHKMLMTLGGFAASKQLKLSDLTTKLTFSSWAATLGPVCIGRSSHIFTFSPISVDKILVTGPQECEIHGDELRAVQESYLNYFKTQWKVTKAMTQRALTQATPFIRGRTFATHADNGNIGHCIQRLMCDIAAAIGSKSEPFNNSINLEVLSQNLVSLVVSGILDTIADVQKPIVVHRFHRSIQNDFLCFEDLTIQRPNSCGPHGLGFRPSNQNQTIRRIRSMLFQRLRLSREVASKDKVHNSTCMKNILIYDRNNTMKRRFLNPMALHESLISNICLNITVIHDIPAAPLMQAKLLNSVDVFITPHSAAAYLSLFLPDGAWLIEIALSTWMKQAMAPIMPIFYYNADFGLDLVQYNSSFDHGGPKPEDRSFYLNKTAIRILSSFIHSSTCVCNRE